MILTFSEEVLDTKEIDQVIELKIVQDEQSN